MKYAMILAAVLLTTTVSQAKTMCNLNTGKDNVYDRILFSGEVDTQKMLIVRKGSAQAEELNYEQLTTVEQWKAINGATIVTFSQENGAYSIAIGQVNMAKGKTNALPLDAIVVGVVSEKNPLQLVLPSKNITALCFDFKF